MWNYCGFFNCIDTCGQKMIRKLQEMTLIINWCNFMTQVIKDISFLKIQNFWTILNWKKSKWAHDLFRVCENALLENIAFNYFTQIFIYFYSLAPCVWNNAVLSKSKKSYHFKLTLQGCYHFPYPVQTKNDKSKNAQVDKKLFYIGNMKQKEPSTTNRE